MVVTVVAVLGAEGGKALLGDLVVDVKDRMVQRLLRRRSDGHLQRMRARVRTQLGGGPPTVEAPTTEAPTADECIATARLAVNTAAERRGWTPLPPDHPVTLHYDQDGWSVTFTVDELRFEVLGDFEHGPIVVQVQE